VVVMIHAGSLRLGHVTGNYVIDVMKRIYPSGAIHPDNGIYPLPAGERFEKEFATFVTSLRNAANFAFGNRFFLAQMVRRGLEMAIGPTPCQVIYDAPHNLMWEEMLDGDAVYVHRKGATPAGAGVIGIIPGSQGHDSFIVRGRGNALSLNSASHGAGRNMSRGEAKRTIPKADRDRWLESRGVELMDAGMDEAPQAYKDIRKVLDEQRDLVEVLAVFRPRVVLMASAAQEPGTGHGLVRTRVHVFGESTGAWFGLTTGASFGESVRVPALCAFTRPRHRSS
jgi:tRNA-splicing ligase RtcB